jgi:hypothetical protein
MASFLKLSSKYVVYFCNLLAYFYSPVVEFCHNKRGTNLGASLQLECWNAGMMGCGRKTINWSFPLSEPITPLFHCARQ